MAKYDDSSWYYGGEYPRDLPKENAATHIGMFLTWCIDNNLISEDLTDDFEEDVQLVKNREMTGPEFLINICDEKLTTEDLNDIGNNFATDYYGLHKAPSKFSLEYADYLTDYDKVFINAVSDISIYEVENTRENYCLLRTILYKRFDEWKKYKIEKYDPSLV